MTCHVCVVDDVDLPKAVIVRVTVPDPWFVSFPVYVHMLLVRSMVKCRDWVDAVIDVAV